MHDAFEPVPILEKLPLQIDCLAAWGERRGCPRTPPHGPWPLPRGPGGGVGGGPREGVLGTPRRFLRLPLGPAPRPRPACGPAPWCPRLSPLPLSPVSPGTPGTQRCPQPPGSLRLFPSAGWVPRGKGSKLFLKTRSRLRILGSLQTTCVTHLERSPGQRLAGIEPPLQGIERVGTGTGLKCDL